MLSAIISRVWREKRIPSRDQFKVRRVWRSHDTFATHCDAIRDTDGVVLPRKHIVVLDMLFDFFAQVQHCGMSACYAHTIDRCALMVSPHVG